ncbi:hypothetical protein GALL_495850 [mine drainage metagenome]|uniref:Uncharacterized protein n=1 Tax=mine drainage metagenome TaxID=410659 RepID=A0A1J5PC73_9ZZZZ
MIASSTTRPIARTIASKVSKLIEYPSICMMKNVPISDSGIATTGTKMALKLPRNRKITTVTITSASTSVLTTSVIDELMKAVES